MICLRNRHDEEIYWRKDRIEGWAYAGDRIYLYTTTNQVHELALIKINEDALNSLYMELGGK